MFVFIMDPLGDGREHSATVTMMRAATERGHAVWHCTATGLSLIGARVHAVARQVGFDGDRPVLGEPTELDPHRATAVLVRIDPPYDILTVTLLLEHLRGDTVMMNDPRGLREANEKLYACRFPDLMPPTMVSADPGRLLAFAAGQPYGAVLKPLSDFKGRGILSVAHGDRNARSIAETTTALGSRPAMAQAFLPEVAEGDKRILLLDGEPLGGFLRRPAGDDFRANMAVGGTVHATGLDEDDLRIVRRIAPSLRADGLHLAGIDVIGGRLTEVNVTSMAGLPQLVELTGGRHDLRIIRWLEDRAERPGKGE
ncbi:glutathione synthase [Streptomyces sp. HU2014]|uniref:glutathione synthase n=1 Tax=Streptomyces sp. HU2014 TaxID=2939414 RepID=UPI0020105CE7|nr:glutathione synthase [Streptomyces sp. HU2014]UQI46250.1 glutathione synthase [Streptomyces sp. HU2014]